MPLKRIRRCGGDAEGWETARRRVGTIATCSDAVASTAASLGLEKEEMEPWRRYRGAAGCMLGVMGGCREVSAMVYLSRVVVLLPKQSIQLYLQSPVPACTELNILIPT